MQLVLAVGAIAESGWCLDGSVGHLLSGCHGSIPFSFASGLGTWVGSYARGGFGCGLGLGLALRSWYAVRVLIRFIGFDPATGARWDRAEWCPEFDSRLPNTLHRAVVRRQRELTPELDERRGKGPELAPSWTPSQLSASVGQSRCL